MRPELSDQDSKAIETALALKCTQPNVLLLVMQKENMSEQEENNRNYFPFYLSLYVQPDTAD